MLFGYTFEILLSPTRPKMDLGSPHLPNSADDLSPTPYASGISSLHGSLCSLVVLLFPISAAPAILTTENGVNTTNAERISQCTCYALCHALSTPANIYQRLAVFLDRPGFPWKRLILGFSLGQYVLEGLLSLRQYKVLQKKKPPKTLEDEISQDVFDQSQVRHSLMSNQ
jgi:hypothetical protein